MPRPPVRVTESVSNWLKLELAEGEWKAAYPDIYAALKAMPGVRGVSQLESGKLLLTVEKGNEPTAEAIKKALAAHKLASLSLSAKDPDPAEWSPWLPEFPAKS
jgi:hypothetical protein